MPHLSPLKWMNLYLWLISWMMIFFIKMNFFMKFNLNKKQYFFNSINNLNWKI
uniref:ATP synthase F0 subunit 8 n=3 Tax=Antodynerus TaxID=2612822 RepID=A0A6M9AWE0_9HYME|nr:ATP synthase F0 subunit 8 [Antodynerus aff. limbatus YN]QKK69223.1 ATP synthase F0 subunit 8 [Antodynerus aff. limbatus GX]QKK69236.1 ATP synthase F0 subunit 8 [Antodynerus aff. limbatus XZ]QKK69249.1 ATP synthase F0 subunit 8 [Antodynerus aff. limbatus YN]